MGKTAKTGLSAAPALQTDEIDAELARLIALWSMLSTDDRQSLVNAAESMLAANHRENPTLETGTPQHADG